MRLSSCVVICSPGEQGSWSGFSIRCLHGRSARVALFSSRCGFWEHEVSQMQGEADGTGRIHCLRVSWARTALSPVQIRLQGKCFYSEVEWFAASVACVIALGKDSAASDSSSASGSLRTGESVRTGCLRCFAGLWQGRPCPLSKFGSCFGVSVFIF